MENQPLVHTYSAPVVDRIFSLARATAVCTLAFVLLACGSARRGEPVAGPMPLASASIERGKKLYDVHCYSCHSAGEGGLGPALNDKPLPKSLIQFQIRHGLGVMPSFPESKLQDQDLEDIAAYMLALRRHGK